MYNNKKTSPKTNTQCLQKFHVNEDILITHASQDKNFCDNERSFIVQNNYNQVARHYLAKPWTPGMENDNKFSHLILKVPPHRKPQPNR